MNSNHQQMYDLCNGHMHMYVVAQMEDGTQHQGIITGVGRDEVELAVPFGPDQGSLADGMRGSDERQYGWGPPRPNYNHFGYGYSPGYYGGYGHRPGGFRRLVLPLAGLVALSTLPWF